MSKNKGLKMQKEWRPKVIEFSGSGWYGEVYQMNDEMWGWCAGIDAGDRLVVRGGLDFYTSDAAARSLQACVVVELAALEHRKKRLFPVA